MPQTEFTRFPPLLEPAVTTPSSTHQVAVVEHAAGPFVLTQRPLPDVSAGQVLVRIHASGVNPLDAKIRAGAAGHAHQPLPAVLGLDMAGVVERVGAGVTRFAPGDQVYGMVGGVGGLPGTLAQYVAADADLLAHKPASLSMREAAALPLIAITAWEGLVDRARVQAGQQVLVQGGAGGVGHIVVQLARAFGAQTWATVSPRQAGAVREYGATPIDYTTSTPEDYVRRHTADEGFDIVYDTVGGATLDASFVAARRYGGHVVSALGWGTHALAPLSFRAATYSGVFTLMPLLTGRGRAHHGEILRRVAALADAGHLRPRVDPTRFGLADAAAAHELATGGRALGKVVVNLV